MRKCLVCGCDISSLHHNRVRCEECQVKFREQYRRNWRKTPQGKIYVSRGHSKRRKLGNLLSTENIFNEKVEFHHITNKKIIALPINLHRLYNGLPREQHRFMCKQIIEQIYENYY